MFCRDGDTDGGRAMAVAARAADRPDPLFARSPRMAAFDWSSTPLGASSSWPADLRAAVRLMLASRFPMWLAWGPALTLIYNDAHARETLRDKHPWALGRPASEVWADVWPDVRGRVEAVLQRGESTWDEDLLLHLDRGDWSEETYYTFSYGPLGADDGTARGLFCVTTATTERVRAQRRMAFLRDLASVTSAPRTLDDLTRSVSDVLRGRPRDVSFGLLYLTDPEAADRARLVAAVGVPADTAAAPRVVGLGEPGWEWPGPVAGDTVVRPLDPATADVVPPGCDRVALVPLVGAGEPDPLGVLVVGLSRHLPFDDGYRDFVELVAAQVTSGVLGARAVESEQRRVAALAELDRVRGTATERLTLVQRATAALSGAATPDDVARVIVERVEDLLGRATQSAVFELDAAAHQLRMLVRRPAEPDPRSHGDVVDLTSDTLLTRAVRSGQPLWVHEPEPGEDPAAQDPELLALMRARGLSKVVSIPLVAAGHVVGALAVGHTERGPLDPGERTTLLALADPGGVALDRARLYRAEHDIAETLQRSLLPQELPVVPRLPVAVRYRAGAAGTSAGGDWYDVVDVGEGRVAVVVGDVVGQGTAAAAVMGQLRTALSGHLLAGHGPARALDLLDRLVGRIPGARASTAICLVIDTVTGDVCWARAGHLPALLVGPTTSRLLTDPEGHGPLLGLGHVRQHERTEGRTTVEVGTSVVLYTDGLVERRGESLDEGLDRLVRVAGHVPFRPPEVLVSALLDELAPQEALDDVAVVVVRLVPAPLELELPADPSQLAGLRRSVRRWAADVGYPDDLRDDVQLALGEAATNAVEHAYGTRPPDGATFSVRLAARADGGVDVEVRDRGRWREVPTDPGYRGRGLDMIRSIGDDAEVDGGRDGTRVAFTVRSPAGRVGAAPSPGAGGPAERPARVEVVREEELRVVVTGDLDLAGSETVRRRLQQADVAEAGTWTLDVSGVGHLASAGIGLLLAATDRGARLVPPGPGPAARALDVSGFPADRT